MTEVPQFIRSQEDLALRKERAALYKRLRPQNDSAWDRYSEKHKADDAFADLLGGGGDFENDGPKLKIKSGNVNDMMRLTKSCYQKLASLTRDTAEQTVQAICSVKLNRFMEETVSAIMSAKFSQIDIPAFVQIISTLHQLYKEFAPLIIPRIVKECSNSDSPINRRRLYVYLLCDLLIVHVEKNATPLIHLMVLMINTDASDKSFKNFQFIWGIIKWAGGDIFGVTRGQDSVVDAVFPREPPGTNSLKKDIVTYFKAFLQTLDELCAKGRANFEKGYELIIRLGSINSRYMQEGKDNRVKYEETKEMAKCIGFLIGKEVPDPWIDEEEMTDLTTIDGVIKVPTRLIPEQTENTILQTANADAFYDIIADMDVHLVEPLGFDIRALKIEVDRAKDSARIDTLARHYALIDKPEDRAELIDSFSAINKNRGNQAKYYARFVADVNQLFPEIGEGIMKNLAKEYMNFISYTCSDGRGNTAPKLHIARYIAELSHFRIGIEDYFKCIDFTLAHFRPRTAEMLCTLINISGKFFDKLCDQTHTNIRNTIAQMKAKKPEIATHQYAIMMVDQTVNAIDPPESVAPIFYTNSYNEYQAFITYIFNTQVDSENFPQKAKKLIEKLLKNPEVTKVNLKFVIDLVLDLSNYSAAQLPSLARFVSKFSKNYPTFGMNIGDIVCERARRLLECPSTNYKQRLVMETRFLAELANPNIDVIPAAAAVKFINFVLSFNVPSPSNLLHKVERAGKTINLYPNRDFTRVFIAAKMIETLIPAFNKDPSLGLDNLLAHIQIYTISRAPVPANVAFRISDLLDTLEMECKDIMRRVKKIETTKDAKEYPYISTVQSDYTFTFLKKPVEIIKNKLIFSRDNQSSDSEEEDNTDELYEASFLREMAEFTDSLDNAASTKNVSREKIPIPLELMGSNGNPHLPRMTSQDGPLHSIEVYTTKNEAITIHIDSAKPQ